MAKSLHIVLVLVLVVCSASSRKCRNHKPHIILIMADDLGWNDVSMHGSSQIPTPNIDAIAYNGQLLHRHYTLPTCTPSRTALLTSMYPFKLGMQGTPLRPAEERVIDTRIKFLAERLKDLNYKTNLIGKWHMGHYNKSATPLGRGFDYFLGYYNGLVGYYDYIVDDREKYGFDLHRNGYLDWQSRGKYATDLFTDEAINIIKNHKKCDPLFLMVSHLAVHTGKNGTGLETHNDEKADKRFKYIQEPKRRLYAEMVRQLDNSTGKIMKALARKKMLKNSIVLFISDNGGQTTDPYYGYSNYASNWPQRGMKFELTEGGVRNIGAIWSPHLKLKNFVNKNIMHISDWYPTFYAAAGGDPKNLEGIDGKNAWPMFTSESNESPERDSIVLNIDEVLKYEGILSGDGRFKFLNGTYPRGTFDDYFGDSGRNEQDPKYDIESVLKSETNQAILRTKNQQPLTTDIILRMRKEAEILEGPGPRKNTCRTQCLYDLQNDPTEKIDVKEKYPQIYEELVKKLDKYRLQLIPQLNTTPDPKGVPENCNNAWFTWKEIYNPQCGPSYAAPA